MLVNVRLVGDMAEKFGHHHQFVVDSAREVFHALAANFQGFRSYLMKSEDHAVAYKILLDETECTEEELKMATAPRFMVVAPIIMGSGIAGKIIAGVAILAIAAFVPFSIGLLGAGVISGSSIGAALLLSGVSQLLSEGNKKDSRLQSTAIGTVVTAKEGDTIPIAYGRVFLKGKLISAGSTVTRR
jgi:predicted phage tail protein